jgi:hypothetical protein
MRSKSSGPPVDEGELVAALDEYQPRWVRLPLLPSPWFQLICLLVRAATKVSFPPSSTMMATAGDRHCLIFKMANGPAVGRAVVWDYAKASGCPRVGFLPWQCPNDAQRQSLLPA